MSQIDKDKFYSGPLGKAWGEDEAPKCAKCGGAYFAGLVPENLCGTCRQAEPVPATPQQPTDRELLEFAAKAAGKTRGDWDYDWLVGLGHKISRDMLWNPLVDDGATLRLSVDMQFNVYHVPPYVYVEDMLRKGSVVLHETYGDDPKDSYAATRRAVTRAAYEIGKAMP